MSGKARSDAPDTPQVALICGQGDGGGQAEARSARLEQVKSLARALAELGYRVTVFIRFGCAAEETTAVSNAEGAAVRTVIIPPAGGRGARGEDAAHCLEQDAEWLEAFIGADAAERGCAPWRCYELVASFFWDAGMLAGMLQCRWRALAAAQGAERMLAGVVPEQSLQMAARKRTWLGLGEAPAYFLGKLLLESDGSPATPLLQRARLAAVKFSRLRSGEGGTEADQLVGAVASALAEARLGSAPVMHELIVAEALGEALLELSPQVSRWLEETFEMIDRHLWAPCSLASQEREHQHERAGAPLKRRRLEDRRSHEQVICDHGNAFMVTSLEVAEHLVSHYHVPCEQMFYFPTCVDRSHFYPRQEHELEPAIDFLCRSSGLAEERLRNGRVVLECGPPEPSQRKELVLDAFSFVARECEDALLVMTGDEGNKLTAELKARRDSRAELRQRVIFTGRPEPALAGPLFSLADVFVSAAEREREGSTLLQAAACGTALVCSDRISLAVHYLQPEALIVPSGEVFDFARAMVDLLDDEQSRHQRGQLLAGKATAFEWKNQARALVEYLQRRGFQVAPPA